MHVKHLQAMLDAVTETRVTMMTTSRVLVGTQIAASLHRRSMAEDTIETTATYMTSSATEMHVAESKTDAEIGSVKSKNSATNGNTIIMVLTTTNLTESIHQKGDTS
jgi:hypothetical protein